MPTLPLLIPGEITAAFAPLAYESDHPGTGVDLLLQQFKGKDAIEWLLKSYLIQAQDVEDALWSILVSTDIDVATDAQLDGIGTLVGEERRGSTDATYRARIKVRILINRSNGRHGEILTILCRLFGLEDTPDSVRLRSRAPGAIDVQVFAAIPVSGSDAGLVLRSSKPAGVEAEGAYPSTTLAAAYRFGWSSAIAGITGAANGDGFNGATPVGGVMAARF